MIFHIGGSCGSGGATKPSSAADGAGTGAAAGSAASSGAAEGASPSVRPASGLTRDARKPACGAGS
eukprot:5417920-Prymnesium_polylepis.1